MVADQTDELIAVGRILKPFGVRGEVRIQSWTDVPDRLEGLDHVILVLPSGEHVPTRVLRVKKDGLGYRIRFEMISTPEQARAYRGAWLKIPKAVVPPLPDGMYYHFELIGLTVQDEEGESLGIVDDVLELPGHHVFVIRDKAGQEWLVPAARQWIIHIDLPARRLIVKDGKAWKAVS
ncbi:MAG: 16S rRNA processing protein RimM [Nitrospirae bacterium]|nr:MAG: 16S rRNA processing protein RimM [Nitrospirota bacterium]